MSMFVCLPGWATNLVFSAPLVSPAQETFRWISQHLCSFTCDPTQAYVGLLNALHEQRQHLIEC